MGKAGSKKRFEMEAAMKERYVTPKSRIFTPSEWTSVVKAYKHPYVPRAELMVRLMVSAMARSQSKRRAGDDTEMLAAALRYEKAERGFLKMADLLEEHLGKLDKSPNLKQLYLWYGAIGSVGDPIPDYPVKFKSISKMKLAHALTEMNITYGSLDASNAEKHGAQIVHEKSMQRWRSLGYMMGPSDLNGCSVDIKKRIRRSLTESDLQEDAKVLARLQLPGVDVSTEGDEHTIITPRNSRPTTPATPERDAAQEINDLMSPDNKKQWTVDAEDSVLARVAKMTILEEIFENVMVDQDLVSALWTDVDDNGNNDMGFSEWRSYAATKCNVLEVHKPTARAFRDATGEQVKLWEAEDAAAAVKADTARADGGDDAALPERRGSNTIGIAADARPGDSVTNESFKFFIARAFQYTKLWYAFQYLDTSGDDRVQFDEYTAGRSKFRQILGMPMDSGMSVEDEFQDMAAPPKDEFGYAGMCDWYRKQIDSGVHTDVSEGKLLGVGGDDDVFDASGMTFDVDSMCTLAFLCHYNTRKVAD